MPTLIVGLIVLAVFILAAKKTIKDKKNGNCGCNCEGCGGHCHDNK